MKPVVRPLIWDASVTEMSCAVRSSKELICMFGWRLRVYKIAGQSTASWPCPVPNDMRIPHCCQARRRRRPAQGAQTGNRRWNSALARSKSRSLAGIESQES